MSSERQGPPASYADHIQLDDLLHLQRPASNSPEEPFFLIAHQTHELWFKALIDLLTRAVAAMDADRFGDAVALMDRSTAIVSLLTRQLRVLATMPTVEFEIIRQAVGSSSAMESDQYQTLGALARSGDPGDRTLWAAFSDARNRAPRSHSIAAIARSLGNYDASWQRWRRLHLRAARRFVGDRAGTGGTTGACYLQRYVDESLFPELVNGA